MSNTEPDKTAIGATSQDSKSSQKLQTYIAACVAIFFFGMEYIVLGSILPIFKETMTEGQITLLATLLPIGVLAGSMLFGPFQDNHGYRRVLIVFTALGILGLSMLASARDYVIIAASVVLVGISSGALNGSASAIMSDISTDKDRATNLVVLGLVYCIGALCTPLAIKAMVKSIGYRWPIVIVACLMLLTIVLYSLIRFPKHESADKVTAKDIAKLLAEPFLWIFSMVLFFQSALEGLSSNWTTQYLTDPRFGLSYDKALLALSAVMLGLAAARVILLFITSKVKLKYIIYTSMCVAAGGAIIMATSKGSQAAALAGSFMIGAGLAITFPGILGVIGNRYPQISGTAFSFALVVALAGNTLLNLLTGSLGAQSYPFVVLGAITMLVIFYSIGIIFVNSQARK
jgi:FHS family glucose/mannose:H+ symporter-like MFS transporter